MTHKDIAVASLGSVCFTRWTICHRLGLPYVTSPFDNLENRTQYQFLNIVELLYGKFRQITESDLEYRELQGTALDNGRPRVFRGYTYVGKKILTPFILPHFFDRLDGGDPWDRWRHKCTAFQETLRDVSTRLLLVSLRLNNGKWEDTPEKRSYIARDTRLLANFLSEHYGRTPADCHILSIIAARDVTKTFVEVESPIFRQVAFPAGDEADMPYYKRKPRQEYIDIAKQYLAEFNQSTQGEQQP